MNTRSMQTVVYILKRHFGVKAKIIIPQNRMVDRETGHVSQQYVEYNIQRMICLPEKFSWDSAGVSRGGITRVDAQFQKGDRKFLIDKKDHAAWSSVHRIVIDGVTYNTVDYTIFPVAIYVIGRADAT